MSRQSPLVFQLYGLYLEGGSTLNFIGKRRRLSKCEASFAALRRFARCCGLKAALRPLNDSSPVFNHTPGPGLYRTAPCKTEGSPPFFLIGIGANTPNILGH